MGRIRRAIRNLSLKKSFMLYMLMFLLLAAVLSSFTINLASNVKNQINRSYADAENKYTLTNGQGKFVVVASSDLNYTSKDNTIINICGYIETWSIPLFFGLCIILSSFLFYRNKLKRPIELLGKASEKIASNDLNFIISYDSKDEMGQLCASFETMRGALEENNKAMWRTMEERKRLNAAFSHDLRTPLTVLRGYTDFLKNYLPQGKISEEKLMSTISTMTGHISQLESYVSMMSEIQKLEDVAVVSQKIEPDVLLEQLNTTAQLLVSNSKIKLLFINEIEKELLHLDISIVMRVYQNLLANAVRYAKNTISIRYQFISGKLCIVVSDDGKGFTKEELKKADMPYYRDRVKTEDNHFGLGLYICKILCERHGGSILIENGKDGGAKVTASFCAI